jgi:hypothetical protein
VTVCGSACGRPDTACDWHIETSTSAKNAFITLAADPFYQGVAS